MALKEVLLDEMRDLYSAENQLVKALPKLQKGAKSKALKDLVAAHLQETKDQVLRLNESFTSIDEKPTGEHCNGMEGLIEEGADSLEKEQEGASFDLGIVGAALRTEHYEIAGYRASISMAKTLGLDKIASLLTENLEEEEAAALKLEAVSRPLLKEAATQPGREETKPKSGKEKYPAQKSREDEKKAAPSIKRKDSTR